jgi:hypothetical protein
MVHSLTLDLNLNENWISLLLQALVPLNIRRKLVNDTGVKKICHTKC